jgi:hypothetical protein
MMERIIIGLAGPAGAGKTTAALYLMRFGMHRMRFAEPFKAVGKILGLDFDVQKETPFDELCGRTPRYFMQRLGHDFGREMIGTDIWAKAWLRAVNRLPPAVSVVVDDLRYDNEVQYVRRAGHSLIIRICRSVDLLKHPSEENSIEVDAMIDNDADIPTLHRRLNNVIAVWLESSGRKSGAFSDFRFHPHLDL